MYFLDERGIIVLVRVVMRPIVVCVPVRIDGLQFVSVCKVGVCKAIQI
jgi:hypothetical protein